MSLYLRRAVFGFLALLTSLSSSAGTSPVNYDIIYVRQARYGDNTNTIWPEVFHPARLDAGADLMLLHTNGTEEVLVAGGIGGVTDPCISFDAQWCYCALYPDLSDAGLNYQYLIPGGITVTNPAQLLLIKNDPSYNEAWPRAVVPWKAIHGTDEPAQLSWLPNDGTVHPDLPAGTPYGIVGTSSFYKRESFPGDVPPWADFFNGLDAFNGRGCR